MSTTNQSNVLWIGALVLTTAAAAFLGFTLAGKSAVSMIYLAGQFAVYALVIAAILRLILLRQRVNKLFVIAFLSIYVAMLVAGMAGIDQKKKLAVTSPETVTEDLQHSTVTGSSTEADKNLAEYERYVKTVLESAIAFKKQFHDEMTEAGWGRLMNAQRLNNDTDMTESRDILVQGKRVITKFETKVNALLENARDGVQSMNVSDAIKRDMLKEMDAEIVKVKTDLAAKWQAERQLADEAGNIIVLLSDHKRWAVQDDKIMFYSAEDLNKFNAYNQNMRLILTRQNELQKRRFEESARDIEAAKEALRKRESS
ncbi:hypothetical protein [Undibacterium sp. TJN19]|uniref:hypothetical protein n=1 Tax=Undibacterium sp. TJN19 TaxID=3413055 RepID=UPI003BF16138